MKKTNGHVGSFVNAAKEAGMDPIFSVFIKGGGSSADGGEITFGGINKAHLKEDTKVTVKVEAGNKYMVQMDEVKFGDIILYKSWSYELHSSRRHRML